MRNRLTGNKFVVLSETKDLFMLYASNKEDTDLIGEILLSAGNDMKGKEFEEANTRCLKEFGYNITEVLAYGSGGIDRFTRINSIDSVYIDYLTPDVSGKVKKKTIRSYKCFAGGDWRHRNNQIVLHEDSGSAWNCAMDILGSPVHMILIKIKRD